MAAFASLGAQTADLIPPGKAHLRDTTQDAARTLETFLTSVERKAFRIAQIALRHEADALDVVQDAMLQLSSRYASRPPEEWRPLFYRILENRVRDVQRRRSVRSRVMAYLPWRGQVEDDTVDPIEQAVDKAPLPPAQLESDEAMAALEQAIAGLLARRWVPAGVAVAAALGLLVLYLPHGRGLGENPVANAGMEDIELLTDNDAVPLNGDQDVDYDFYEWAAEEAAGATAPTLGS